MGYRRAFAIAATACAAWFAVSPALAQDPVERFFSGKNVNIYIGAAAGGGYDLYARLLSRHLGKYIPGNPTIIPHNMPGAAGNRAAGYVFAQAPKDGTAIGALQPGTVVQPLLNDSRVPHDPSKFIFLGSATNDVFLCLIRSDAPVQSFKETLTTELIMGASGQVGSLYQHLVLLNNVLGTKFRIVSGYAGGHEVNLALERGEVQGQCGLGWSSLQAQHSDWIKSKFIKVIAQADLKGHPDLNVLGIPLTVEFAKTDEDRQIMQLIYSQNLFGRPYVLPPGVPAERVAALRKAFVAALQDQDLLAEAKKVNVDIAPMSGDDMQSLVAKLYALPTGVVERARRSMIYKAPPN